MRNKERRVISILIAGITAITFVLGVLMYASNLKATRQSIIGVELADFIYNINYGMRFGKQIDTFYGMDEMLQARKEDYSDILDLYIVSDNNRVLFSTAESQPENKICALEAGDNLTDRGDLYCMFGLDENARILVRTDRSILVSELLGHMKVLGLKAVIGASAAVAAIMLISFFVKKSRLFSVLSAVLLVIWIVVFGVMIGHGGYLAYRSSVDTVFDTVRYAINSDFERLDQLGVPEDGIHEVDQYLKRYSDMIPEIDEVRIDGEEISFEESRRYENGILLDYMLQALLLLSFSLIIFAELHIYMKQNSAKEEAVRDGTS